jgi:hypothetical protein
MTGCFIPLKEARSKVRQRLWRALRELAGKRFDPQLTDAFIAMLEKDGGLSGYARPPALLSRGI